MQTFEVTQKIVSVSPSYVVRAPENETVLATVNGKLLSLTPQLNMVEGDKGKEIASMKANLMKTKFLIFNEAKAEVGTLEFPMVAINKSFTLTLGEKAYKAEGGMLAGTFTCKGTDGVKVLEIAKLLAVGDKFRVDLEDEIPRDVALLCCVAVDQKYFEGKH